MIFKVFEDNVELHSAASLDEAMTFAKSREKFVSIVGTDFEVVDKFGVDSVIDGKTPDGVAYTWNKASRIGRAKKQRT